LVAAVDGDHDDAGLNYRIFPFDFGVVGKGEFGGFDG